MAWLNLIRTGIPGSVGLLLLMLVVHAAVGTQAFPAPGLYLDTIFPDYLAVRIVDPLSPTDIWMWPGNLVWHRFPFSSGAAYLGNLTAYFTVPFYLAFGGTLLSIRVAHLCLALVIVAVAFEAVRGATRSAIAAAVATLALATDPGFVFAFRTQAHVTTFAVAFTIVGLYLLAQNTLLPRKYVAAGLFLGFSLWGYFIYAFLCPGVLIFLLTSNAGSQRATWRAIVAVGSGFTLGLLPYLLSFGLLLVSLGGLFQTWHFISAVVQGLHIDIGQGFIERASSVLEFVSSAITGEWIWRMIWSVNHLDPMQITKVLGLLLFPLPAVPLCHGNRPAHRMFRLVGACIISYILTATLFGGRLGGHHFVLLIPLLYVLAGLAVAIYLERCSARVCICFSLILGALIIANIVESEVIVDRLNEDSGVGFYSTVVNQYPLEAAARGDRTPHIFIDWGGLLQFIYLTEGKIPAYDAVQLTSSQTITLSKALCKFPKAKLVYIGRAATERGLENIMNEHLDWTSVETLSDHRTGFEYAIIGVKGGNESCER